MRKLGTENDAYLVVTTMQALGWSQADLAKAVGYTQASVSHWINRVRPLPKLVRDVLALLKLMSFDAEHFGTITLADLRKVLNRDDPGLRAHK